MKRLSKKETKTVLEKLEKEFPDARAELDFTNPFELLIATILSAQCTDVRVNIITKVLFEKFKTPEDYIKLSAEELGSIIKSCGLYKTKSQNILATCNILIDRYDGKIPDTMEDLITLPGVGRKTANVVLSNAFNVPAIAVDTHVFRVSNRIGIANSNNVLDTERDLMDNIEREVWSKAHHLLIFHGRRICKARNPLCHICPVSEHCIYYKTEVNKKEGIK
ncbi:MAG: endonuclease III [Tissierellaceae bacterium]|nr:endonuclease III [Tissierellaceae bacterium]